MSNVQSVAEMPFIAGHSALDFVNTAEERGHPEADDALRTPADLHLWGQRYGLIARSAAADEDEEAEHERTREARELLYALFFARVQRTPLPKAKLRHLGELAATAYRAASLDPADGSVRWHWSRSQLSTVRHAAVTSGIELLRTEPFPRLKQCPGQHCGWFFLDVTKRGNRRWCSMSECGQDTKNRKRRKTTSPQRRPGS
jgi:predicted RNA-binding Zn ribbon-like protein